MWIDVSHLGAEMVERNFRGMVRRCRDFGRDLARGPVEVGPTAHFLMGGVVIDPACRTSIEGLFAAGEDTGGVHGANRLGGNGVAESTVFGGLAGDVMAAFVEGRPAPRVAESALTPLVAALTAPFTRAAGPGLYDLQRDLRDVMWERAGLVRDAEGLGAARAEIERIDARPRPRRRGRRSVTQHRVAGLAQSQEPGAGGPADRALGARAAREPGRALAPRFSRAGGDTALHGARRAGPPTGPACGRSPSSSAGPLRPELPCRRRSRSGTEAERMLHASS